MSSLIAHLAAGAMVYACRQPRGPRVRSLPLLMACATLAVLPDLDYLVWWQWSVQLEPRITHSVGFAAITAGLAWVLFCGGRQAGPMTPASLALTLFVAAASHDLLDFLVGVHASPWLWPFSGNPFTSPVGVLPSAGRLDWRNAYLWRNLLIELAVPGPAMLALCAGCRNGPRFARSAWLSLAAVASAALAWSISLPR